MQMLLKMAEKKALNTGKPQDMQLVKYFSAYFVKMGALKDGNAE